VPPHTRKEKIGISDNEIAACLGPEQASHWQSKERTRHGTRDRLVFFRPKATRRPGTRVRQKALPRRLRGGPAL